MVKRLSSELRKTYNDIIHDQIARGFIERVLVDDTMCGHYLPHAHPVIRDSPTTPVRIVYDCSCKSGDAPSLNDCLETGPALHNDLTAILVRFRIHQLAITTDIEKAFLNVSLDEQDRKFTKFLWLADSSDPESHFEVYQFKVVLFGASCSPFILNAAVRTHLERNNSPTSSDMRENIYVDNVITGCQSADDVINYYEESNKVMQSGGFRLRSWSSNFQELRDHAQTDQILHSNMVANVLGLNWDTDQDTLVYPTRKTKPIADDMVTKREVVQATSSLYDLLGLLSPVSVKAKIFIQDLWKKLHWDEPLPEDLCQTWGKLNDELLVATMSCTIQRKYFDCPESCSDPYQLHVFADASAKAYGAVAYLKHGSEIMSIVMAKTRVVPIKSLTLPRLELMATLIASRLLNYLHTNLKLQINIGRCVLWADSQIVLHWVQSRKKLPTFVENHVKEIRSYTVIDEFRYCPTKDNPADMLTRGISASDIQCATLWWKGPSWLGIGNWPVCDLFSNHDDALLLCSEESLPVRHDSVFHNSVSESVKPNVASVINPAEYSSYTSLLRVSALVQHFLSNLRNRQQRKVGPLNASEIQSAEMLWIRSIQCHAYSDEIESLLSKQRANGPLVRQLHLFMDDDGLLRTGGRLHSALLSYETCIHGACDLGCSF